MELLSANSGTKVRRATLNGRKYLVVSASILVPGVLNGSQGPLYYSPSEISKNPGIWNGIPITKGHPTDRNGNPVFARNPEVLNKVQLGTVYGDRWTGKKRVVEAWYDIELTRERAPKTYAKLMSGDPGELSTGLSTVNVPIRNGVDPVNGRAYTHLATDYKPDHLADLTEVGQVGACSVKDGCGTHVENTLCENCRNPLHKGPCKGSKRKHSTPTKTTPNPNEGPHKSKHDQVGYHDPKDRDSDDRATTKKLKSADKKVAEARTKLDSATAKQDRVIDLQAKLGAADARVESTKKARDESKARLEALRKKLKASKLRLRKLTRNAGLCCNCRNPLHPGPCKGFKRGAKTATPSTTSPKAPTKPTKSKGELETGLTSGGQALPKDHPVSKARSEAAAASKGNSPEAKKLRGDFVAGVLKDPTTSLSGKEGFAKLGQLAGHLGNMTVGESRAALKQFGLKGGKTKLEMSQRLYDHARNTLSYESAGLSDPTAKSRQAPPSPKKSFWKGLFTDLKKDFLKVTFLGNAASKWINFVVVSNTEDDATKVSRYDLIAGAMLIATRDQDTDTINALLAAHVTDGPTTNSNRTPHSSPGLTMPLTPKERRRTVQFLTTNCGCWKGKNAEATLNGMDDDQLTTLKSEAEKVRFNEAVVNAAKSTLGDKLDLTDVALDDVPTLVANAMTVPAGKKMKKKSREGCEDTETETMNADPKDDDQDDDHTDAKPPTGNKRTQPMTEQEWLASAPPTVANAFKTARRIEGRERATLTSKLTKIAETTQNAAKKRLITNKLKSNPSLEELDDMLTLVHEPDQNQTHNGRTDDDYGGSYLPGGPDRVTNSEDDDEDVAPLVAPTINWDEVSKQNSQRRHADSAA